MQTITYEDVSVIEWLTTVIGEFSRTLRIKMQPAYAYLHQFGGLDYLVNHYDALHTFSIEEAVANAISICNRKGGGLTA